MIGDMTNYRDPITGIKQEKVIIKPTKQAPLQQRAMKFDPIKEANGGDSIQDNYETEYDDDGTIDAVESYRKRIGLR